MAALGRSDTGPRLGQSFVLNWLFCSAGTVLIVSVFSLWVLAIGPYQ